VPNVPCKAIFAIVYVIVLRASVLPCCKPRALRPARFRAVLSNRMYDQCKCSHRAGLPKRFQTAACHTPLPICLQGVSSASPGLCFEGGRFLKAHEDSLESHRAFSGMPVGRSAHIGVRGSSGEATAKLLLNVNLQHPGEPPSSFTSRLRSLSAPPSDRTSTTLPRVTVIPRSAACGQTYGKGALVLLESFRRRLVQSLCHRFVGPRDDSRTPQPLHANRLASRTTSPQPKYAMADFTLQPPCR
jgi:hypothetical protein